MKKGILKWHRKIPLINGAQSVLKLIGKNDAQLRNWRLSGALIRDKALELIIVRTACKDNRKLGTYLSIVGIDNSVAP